MTYSQHIKSNILFSLNKLDIDFNKKITNYEVWQQVIMQNFQSVKLLSIAILILEALYTMWTLNLIIQRNGTNKFLKKFDQEKTNPFIIY